jgi:hypothetical protein
LHRSGGRQTTNRRDRYQSGPDLEIGSAYHHEGSLAVRYDDCEPIIDDVSAVDPPDSVWDWIAMVCREIMAHKLGLNYQHSTGPIDSAANPTTITVVDLWPDPMSP